MRSGGSGENEHHAAFDALRGQSVDYAIQEIARLLTPQNGDASKISRSLQLALSQSLEGMEAFNPSSISDEILTDMLVIYVRESIFEQIVMESGRAFQKTDNIDTLFAAEQGLRDLVSVCVDKTLRDLVSSGIGNMSTQELFEAQQAAIAAIWAEWESYQ